MTAPRRQNKADRLMHPGASAAAIRCDYAVAPLDRAADEMNRKWGVDKLPSLVSPAMAEKYGGAMAHLNACIDAENADECAAAAANCIRGLQAMDAEACRLGQPQADPRVTQIEVDGVAYGFVADPAYLEAAERAHPHLTIHTLRQAVVALHPERFGLAAEVKRVFPGATVAAIRPRSTLEAVLEDEIPFIMEWRV